MLNLPGIRSEARYGMPAADQIVVNRFYTIGYAYYFRQAKWALEIVDPKKTDVQRADNFRPDYRIPELFRADLADYEASGYDRGHLIASANHEETELQNSETFLLSNMSPQKPDFNRGIWKKLEEAVRALSAKEHILEVYVICGPIFNFSIPIEEIGSKDSNGVTLPIPHAYFKSVLAEDDRGALSMWSFMMPNEGSDKPLSEFLVPTSKVDKYSGLHIWNLLVGSVIEKERTTVRPMWKF